MCVCIVGCGVLFCKQKTAYEMRISDWSSDVCSSDLQKLSKRLAPLIAPPVSCAIQRPLGSARSSERKTGAPSGTYLGSAATLARPVTGTPKAPNGPGPLQRPERSEEHTSELQ